MGNNTAKTTITSISNQITDVAMSSVQDCQVISQQKQNLNVTNTGWRLFGNYSMKQTTDVSVQCFSNVNRQAQLQNNIVNAIAQASTSTGQAVWPAFGSTQAKAVQNIQNNITNKVTMSNIQKTYNAIRQGQSAKIVNSGVTLWEAVDMTQGAQVFAAATLQEVAKTGVFNTIENHLQQSADAKTEGPLSGLFDNLVYVFLAVLILVFAGLAWVVFGEATPQQSAFPPIAQPAQQPTVAATAV